MRRIIFISGPCGCGKTTLADRLARALVAQSRRTVYVIHGDDFHQGFVEPEDKGDFFQEGEPSDRVQWEAILSFNWDCILSVADRALRQDLDVVIDYVIEEELPRVKSLAEKHGAALSYIVLTASEEALEARIRQRGDVDMIERARFLKRKLEALPENRGHLLDSTERSPDELVRAIDPDAFRVL